MNPIDQLIEPDVGESKKSESGFSRAMLDRLHADMELDRQRMKENPELRKLMEDDTCPTCFDCDLTPKPKKKDNWYDRYPIELPPVM